MDYGVERTLQDLQATVQKSHRESMGQSEMMADELHRAFAQAQENSEQRYQAMIELTEQMKLGQAIQVIQYGMRNNQYSSDAERIEMRNLYDKLSTKVIADAKQLVGSSAYTHSTPPVRGSEFDDLLEKSEQTLDSHVLE